MASVLSLIAVIYLLGSLPFEWQAALLSFLILLLGIPHGALDHKVAEATGLVKNRFALFLFLLAYLLMSVCGFVLWIFFPSVSLLFFLVISAWHFGSDFSKFSSLKSFPIVPGIALLSTPFVFYQNDVAQIFSIFIEEDEAAIVSVVGRYVAYIFIPLSGAFAILRSNIPFESRLDFIMTLIAGLFLPPLMFLVVFFCLSHSLKHLSELYVTLEFRTVKKFCLTLLPLTLSSYILLGAIALNYEAIDLAALSLKSTIILLSVLTIPHMLLIEYWKSQQT